MNKTLKVFLVGFFVLVASSGALLVFSNYNKPCTAQQCPTCASEKQCQTCPPEKQCPPEKVCSEKQCPEVKECEKYEPEPPPKNFTFIPYSYFQVFPLERYPGIKCYTIATEKRHLVYSYGCEVVRVDSENITIGRYIIPKQAPRKVCDRCYSSDYLNIVAFVLFGKPDEGIEPLAPKGAVFFEDDTVACNSALEILDQCFKEQTNCILGYGAWMNYYAGTNTEQPNPDKYGEKRFTKLEHIFHPRTRNHDHADWLVRALGRQGIESDRVNHLGYTSVLNHVHDDFEQVYRLRCPMEESLAGQKVIVKRPGDISTVRM